MASNINPNNIDGSYPVAGQDNNSQGFRDNFTNTKVNFQYAAEEIDDLQTNVLLKAALTGSTLDNNMNDNLIYAAKVQDFSFTKSALTATSGAVTINYAAGHYQTVSPSAGSISLSFTNWPASGTWGWVRVSILVTNTAYTVTLPAAVNVNTSGIQGLYTPTNTLTFAAPGTYEFDFSTSNGGTNITVSTNSQTLSPFSNSAEDLANAAAVSLATTTSYFSTTGAWTATLADGVNGQIKTLIMRASAGNMVITVASPAWGGAGTITFANQGQGCTLQYIMGQWYCIGNNGAVFA